MKIEKNSRLLFIGDSVTDCGRGYPIGEGNAIGDGYVKNIHGLLSAFYPDYRICVENTGISGNTVRDLKNRWKSDVLDLHPDWLSIMIGINDVGRQFDSFYRTEKYVYLDEYRQTLNELVAKTKGCVKGLVLMTPFFIESRQNDPMRMMLESYRDAVKNIARSNDILLVDTQQAFDDVMKHVPTASISWDRVHPGIQGHMVLAKAFLNAIGFNWNRKL